MQREFALSVWYDKARLPPNFDIVFVVAEATATLYSDVLNKSMINIRNYQIEDNT